MSSVEGTTLQEKTAPKGSARSARRAHSQEPIRNEPAPTSHFPPRVAESTGASATRYSNPVPTPIPPTASSAKPTTAAEVLVLHSAFGNAAIARAAQASRISSPSPVVNTAPSPVGQGKETKPPSTPQPAPASPPAHSVSAHDGTSTSLVDSTSAIATALPSSATEAAHTATPATRGRTTTPSKSAAIAKPSSKTRALASGGAHAADRGASRPHGAAARDSESLLQSLAKLPPDSLGTAVTAAQAAAPHIQAREKADLEASLSGIPAPVGLPPSGHPPVAAPTRLSHSTAPEMAGATARQGLPPDTRAPDAEGPVPGDTVSTAANEPDDEGGGGSWFDWLVSRISGFFGELPTNDPGLSTSAGPRPTVDTTGDADLTRTDQHREMSEEVVGTQREGADALTAADFGEHHILPTAAPGTLSPYKAGGPPKPTGAGAPGTAKHSISLDQATFDPNLGSELNSKVGEDLERYKVDRVEYEKQSKQTRDEGDRRMSEESEHARAEQEGLRQEAQGEVANRRQQWRQENQQVQKDYSAKARDKHNETEAQIGSKVQASQAQADQELSRAEKQAETERKAAEARAAEEKKKSEEKPKSWWQRVKGSISSVFSAIKRAINGIFNALRKVVGAIIAGAKALVHGIIEAARAAIVGLIKAFGEILKGLVSIALAAFPELAARARAWIDNRVDAAVQTVNKIADKLKKIADGILDWVGRTIDRALAILQSVVLAILDVIAAIASGLARILEILADIRPALKFISSLYENRDKIIQKAKLWLGEMIERTPPKAESLIQGEIDKQGSAAPSSLAADIAAPKAAGAAAATVTTAAPKTVAASSTASLSASLKSAGGKALTTLGKHLSGIWNAFKKGVVQLKDTWWEHVKTMLWDLIPEVALYHGLKAMWEDGKEAVKLLFSGHFSKAINYALKIVQDFWGMIGSFMLTAAILLAIAGFIIGAVLGEGVGAIPGMAAATSIMEIAGLALLGIMLQVETVVVLKAIYDLATGAEEDYPDAYSRIASSGITVALLIVMMIVAWLATKLGSLIGRALREALKRLGIDIPKLPSGIDPDKPIDPQHPEGRPQPEHPTDAPRTPTGEIDFDAWESRLKSKGIKGEVEDVIAKAQAGDNASAAELRVAERYLDAGYEVEFVQPESGPGAAQGEQSADLRVNRPGEKPTRVEVKSRAPGEQISKSNLNQAIDKANDQVKASGEARGDIIVDQTDAAPGGAGQAEIENFTRGKMTDSRLKSIDYLEIVYKEGGEVKRTFIVRTADGKVNGPFTEKLK
jgi:hypothetical protein